MTAITDDVIAMDTDLKKRLSWMPSDVNCIRRSRLLPAGMVRNGISSSANATPTIQPP